MLKRSLFILACLAFGSPVYASVIGLSPNHPEREWKVIETPHFLIHYYQGNSKIAREMAVIAEEVYPKITSDIDAEPKQKVPVIINEDDYFNGSAEAFRNRIVLDPTVARTSYIGSRRFIAHEFTHVITYEAFDNGLPFSKVYNSSNVPLWFFEGLAQYEAEYWYPSYDRMLCLHTLNHSILTTSERNAFGILSDSHTGASGYNEGYSFIKYILDKYGHKNLPKLFTNIKNVNNYNFPRAINITFGKNLNELEDEWKNFLEQDYKKKTEGKDSSIPGSEPVITRKNEDANTKFKFSNDEKLIAYLSSFQKSGFTLFRGNLIGMMPLYVALPDNSEKLMINGKVIDYSWSPNEPKIAYTHTAANELGLVTTELSVAEIEIKDNKPELRNKEKITSGLKPVSLTWSPDGKTIAATCTEDEITNIVLIDPDKKEKIRNITKTIDNNQYKDLAWSPDGKFIAAISYYPGDGGSLVIIDPQSGDVKKITDYSFLYFNYHPVWSPDSQSIYFTSDKDGFLNLYQYSFPSGETSKLTNTYTGVEAPYVTKDGKNIYYTQFYAKGTEIRKWKFPKSQDETIKLSETLDKLEMVPYAPKNIFDSYKLSIEPYSINIQPDIIMPLTGYDERGDQIGLIGLFSDILEQHEISARALYGIASGRPSYIAEYKNSMFAPTLSAEVHDYLNLAITRDGQEPYYERNQGLKFSIEHPLFNKIADDKDKPEKNGILGKVEMEFANLSFIPSSMGTEQKNARVGKNNLINLILSNDSVSGSLQSFHPQNGYKGSIKLTYGGSLIGSNFNFYQLFFDARAYIPVIPDWEHVIALYGLGGVNFGDTTPFILGGPPLTSSLGYQDFVPLRGLRTAELIGDRLGMLSVEYRFPIFKHMDFPAGGFYFDKLYGALFLDAGDSWFESERWPVPYSGFGAELRLRVASGYKNPFSVYFGIGQPIYSDEYSSGYTVWPKVYFGFANVF